MRIAVIDNYDSFTYNLVHLVKSLGVEVDVFRNDQFRLSSLEPYDKLLLSPGPGIPGEAGLLLEVIKTYAPRKPILGICLGHQAIGEVFGGRLVRLHQVYHGVATPCEQMMDEPLFADLPRHFEVGRYHSWVVSREDFPDCLQVTALSSDGQVMALRHKQYDVCGLQFHPESVLTPLGETILSDWIRR